jgi:hypothetical protein
MVDVILCGRGKRLCLRNHSETSSPSDSPITGGSYIQDKEADVCRYLEPNSNLCISVTLTSLDDPILKADFLRYVTNLGFSMACQIQYRRIE